MEIAKAQQEVRMTFLGGFVGQMVSACLWLISSALSTWHSLKAGALFLVIGGFFIFPIIQFILRTAKRPNSLSVENPFNQLAIQVAFTLPLCLPLVGIAFLYRPTLFYPAFMVILGAHYLPFTFLYGMRMFLPLCGLLVAAGLVIGLYLPPTLALGGWVTSVILMVFAVVGKVVVDRERSSLA